MVGRRGAAEAHPVSDPALSVVIPTYNGRRLLETCLASIFRHRPESMAVEVIVVDDASTDGTEAWLRSTYPEVVLVRRPVNGGFVAAANAGIERARGRVVQLLNNDAEVTSGWVEAGLAPFRDSAVGSVAPLVLVRSNESQVDSAGDGYSLLGWPFKRGHRQRADAWAGRPPEAVFGASASSAFYRAEALRTVGGFDPIYGSYYEDVDLAFRLRWAGYSCVYAPACRVRHEISASYDHARPELQRRMSRNAEILFWSNMPRGWLAVSAAPHLAFLIIQGIGRLGRGRFRSYVQGKWDAARMAGVIRDRRRVRQNLSREAARLPSFPFELIPWSEARRPRGPVGRAAPGPHIHRDASEPGPAPAPRR
jgi:GT2 family glycosyltransferase